MKYLTLTLAVGAMLLANAAMGQVPNGNSQIAAWQRNLSQVRFTENLGQYADETGAPLQGVFFRAEVGNAVVYMTEWGLSYYFYRSFPSEADAKTEVQSLAWERVDMDILGASIRPENISQNGKSGHYTNYYRSHCPQGILNVHSYTDIVVRDIYPGIDWHIQCRQGQDGFEQDFVVHPGADPSRIQLRYEGSEHLQTQISEANLQAICSLGNINEGGLIGYASDERIDIAYAELGHHTYGFAIQEEFDGGHDLVIDPNVRVWATFLGGNGNETNFQTMYGDGQAVYIVGRTSSTDWSALSPNFLDTIAGGVDAYLIKFNLQDSLEWGLFYGSTGNETGDGVYSNGNKVWLLGTTPLTVPADSLAGAYNQPGSAGGDECFLARFDAAGVRDWATHFGGAGSDQTGSLVSDGRHLWLSMQTNSSLNFPGTCASQGFGGIYDTYIAKFSMNGALVCGRYYGGDGVEGGGSLFADGKWLWLTDGTYSGNIANSGPNGSFHWPASGPLGLPDPYITKFDTTNLSVLWSTYFGGGGSDGGGSIYSDGNQAWWTGGATNLGPWGTTSGTSDAFLAKFDANMDTLLNLRLIGGSGSEAGRVVHGDSSNIWVTGYTASANFPIVDPGGGAYVDSNSGGFDAFIVQLDQSDSILWSTCYGGADEDQGFSVYSDDDHLWVFGMTSSNSPSFPVLNSGGYFQAIAGGGSVPYDAFLLKFAVCGQFFPTIQSNSPLCEGDTLQLGSTAGNSFSWSGPSGFLSSSANPTLSNVDSFASGTYYLTVADSNGCIENLSTQVIVNPIPVHTWGVQDPICGLMDGAIYTTPQAGMPIYVYEWNTGESTSGIVGLDSGYYWVTITDANGCVFQSDTIHLICVVGLEDVRSDLHLQLYPNPNDGRFQLTWEANGSVQAQLYIVDALGRTVYQTELESGMDPQRFQYDGRDLANGLYLVQVQEGSQRLQQMWVKF